MMLPARNGCTGRSMGWWVSEQHWAGTKGWGCFSSLCRCCLNLEKPWLNPAPSSAGRESSYPARVSQVQSRALLMEQIIARFPPAL